MWNKLGVLLVALVLSMGVSYGKKVGGGDFLVAVQALNDTGITSTGQCVRLIDTESGSQVLANCTSGAESNPSVYVNLHARTLVLTGLGLKNNSGGAYGADGICTMTVQTGTDTDLATGATDYSPSSITTGTGGDVNAAEASGYTSFNLAVPQNSWFRVRIVETTPASGACTAIELSQIYVWGHYN